MKTTIGIAIAAFAAIFSFSCFAQTSSARVVSSCGSASYNSGTQAPITIDTSGNLCGASVIIVPSPSSSNGVSIIASTALESGHVFKASAGNLYSLTGQTDGTVAGQVMIFDATAAPGDGAVTPKACIYIPQSGAPVNFSYSPADIPAAFATGITVVFSSGVTCFTKTASAHAFFSGRVQ